MDNPLVLDAALPDFERIRAEHALVAIDTTLNSARERIERLIRATQAAAQTTCGQQQT